MYLDSKQIKTKSHHLHIITIGPPYSCDSLREEVVTLYLDPIDHFFSLSQFNLMSQLDLLDILMSQVLPHGLTPELSKESYYVVFHQI